MGDAANVPPFCLNDILRRTEEEARRVHSKHGELFDIMQFTVFLVYNISFFVHFHAAHFRHGMVFVDSRQHDFTPRATLTAKGDNLNNNYFLRRSCPPLLELCIFSKFVKLRSNHIAYFPYLFKGPENKKFPEISFARFSTHIVYKRYRE